MEDGNLWDVTVDDTALAWDAEFSEFYQREHLALARSLFLMTGSSVEADELTQEAFVRVLERWSRVRTMQSPVAYLYRTAVNTHRSRLRRLAIAVRNTVDRDSSLSEIDQIEDRDEITRLLAKLSAKQREAIVLTEWLGLDSSTAAAAMGIRPSTLRVHIARGKRALRDEIGEIDD